MAQGTASLLVPIAFQISYYAILVYCIITGGLPKVSGITEGKGVRVMLADIPG